MFSAITASPVIETGAGKFGTKKVHDASHKDCLLTPVDIEAEKEGSLKVGSLWMMIMKEVEVRDGMGGNDEESRSRSWQTTGSRSGRGNGDGLCSHRRFRLVFV